MNENWIDRLAFKIRPSLAEKSGLERAASLINMSGLITAAPIMLFGIGWLILTTIPTSLQAIKWVHLLIVLAIMTLLEQLNFELQLEVTKVARATAQGTLTNMVLWAAVLMFGPVALWNQVLLSSIKFVMKWRRESSRDLRWTHVRVLFQDYGLTIVAGLCGWTLYQWLGGTVPLPGLAWQVVRTAVLPTLVYLIVPIILFAPFIIRFMSTTATLGDSVAVTPIRSAQFMLMAVNLSNAALPFAILAAGLYGDYGLGIFLFFTIGILMASVLANRLSQTAQYAQQRSRELAILESLGRDIINAPPEQLQLDKLLAQHLEGMLHNSLLYIWLTPDTVLFETSALAKMPNVEKAKALLQQQDAPYYQLAGVRLPEETVGLITRNGLVLPILDENHQLLGGIYVLHREDLGNVLAFLPAMQSLASQIASALNREAAYAQSIANEKMARELEVAGRIQATFLPDSLPEISGWDVAATIEPARQTSGDFYDFVALGNGRFAVIVADVADKGTGAALYMALSRTLIRTYAMQFPDSPADVLAAANERILADTFSDQFVTVFYGVLNCREHALTYANAGHNPAFLISENGRLVPQALSKTGIPLGMFEAMSWRNNIVSFSPGDCLVMYTDGVTEAQNHAREEFGESRLLGVLGQALENGRSAQQMQQAIIDAIHTFTGDAPQFDDITLMILQRE